MDFMFCPSFIQPFGVKRKFLSFFPSSALSISIYILIANKYKLSNFWTNVNLQKLAVPGKKSLSLKLRKEIYIYRETQYSEKINGRLLFLKLGRDIKEEGSRF